MDNEQSFGSRKPNDSKKRYFVSPESILRYLITTDEDLETQIICKEHEVELFTTDLALHEAFGSIQPSDKLKTSKIAKLFENVDVHSFRKFKGEEKPVLTHKRVDELRALALKETH